jgi:hypothetical protein
VFDEKKMIKDQVIEAFEQIIRTDDYLRLHWGGKDADPAKIRELLDKVIESDPRLVIRRFFGQRAVIPAHLPPTSPCREKF